MQARGSSSWRVRPSKAGEAPRPFPGSDVLGQFAEEGINPPDSLCPHPATHVTALVPGAGTKGLWLSPFPASVSGTYVALTSGHSVRPSAHSLLQGQHRHPASQH